LGGRSALKSGVFFIFQGFSAVLGRGGIIKSTVGTIKSAAGTIKSAAGIIKSTAGIVPATAKFVQERAGMVERYWVRLFRRARKTGQLRSYPVAWKLFIVLLQKKNAPSFLKSARS
jgi:hypothetical protein